jgi:hypothetical protein
MTNENIKGMFEDTYDHEEKVEELPESDILDEPSGFVGVPGSPLASFTGGGHAGDGVTFVGGGAAGCVSGGSGVGTGGGLIDEKG